MLTVTRVAKQKTNKPADQGGPGGGDDEKKKPKKELVQLPPVFKQKLQLIAQDAGIDMGRLIEKQMGDFVDREYLLVLEKKLAEARSSQKK